MHGTQEGRKFSNLCLRPEANQPLALCPLRYQFLRYSRSPKPRANERVNVPLVNTREIYTPRASSSSTLFTLSISLCVHAFFVLFSSLSQINRFRSNAGYSNLPLFMHALHFASCFDVIRSFGCTLI